MRRNVPPSRKDSCSSYLFPLTSGQRGGLGPNAGKNLPPHREVVRVPLWSLSGVGPSLGAPPHPAPVRHAAQPLFLSDVHVADLRL